MNKNRLFGWSKWLAVSSTVFVVMGCGSGGSSNDKVVGESSESSTSVAVSSAASSMVSSMAASSEAASVSSESNTTAARTLYTKVTVADGYVLGAVVKIGETSNDIDGGEGVYEWLENVTGAITTQGGANDIAEPLGEATEDDPNAYPLRAPEGYSHVNPFTTLLVDGAANLDTTYPHASAYNGEDELKYNFDVVAVGNCETQSGCAIAKEAAKAALAVAEQSEGSAVTSSSSAGSDSSTGSQGDAGDGLSITTPTDGTSSSTAAASGEPFPAAARSVLTPQEEIDACETNACINDVLLSVFMQKFGAFEAPCIPLPGVEACLNYAPVFSNTQESGSASSGGASAGISSAAASSSAAPIITNPFPSTQL